jgi:hypothetical protein
LVGRFSAATELLGEVSSIQTAKTLLKGLEKNGARENTERHGEIPAIRIEIQDRYSRQKLESAREEPS